MHETIAHLNVEHFRKKLAEAGDDRQRKMVQDLLAEEEGKLAAFSPSQERHIKLSRE